MLNGLDLFSGIGGISLALNPWVRTVCYVEIDRYCQGVIRSRISEGKLEDAPIWDDVTTFDPDPWVGAVDIVTGGFPCQDISVAGAGKGLEGERSGLFYEIIRISSIIRPTFIFLENVPAILGRGGGTVISEIASLGYDSRWGILSAYDVGAPHLRERWWCLAYAAGDGREGECKTGISTEGCRSVGTPDELTRTGEQRDVADSDKAGLPRNRTSGLQTEHPLPSGASDVAHAASVRCDRNTAVTGSIGKDEKERWEPESEGGSNANPNSEQEVWIAEPWGECGQWEFEPDVGRVANGVPMRVDRLKGVGNSVVPATAREAFKRLMGIKI